MLEEPIKQPLDIEKEKSIFINKQVVKLLQEKTLPLNRMRYLHLQKINQTSAKSTTNSRSSTPQLQLHLQFKSPKTHQLPALPKSRSSRLYHQSSADLLINRLKNLKDLKNSSQLLLKDERAGFCWEHLRTSIIASQETGRTINNSLRNSHKMLKNSENGRRHKQHFLELTERAERYLRIKKHELKQNYCQDEEYHYTRKKKPASPSQIEKLLTTFKQLKQGGATMTDEQLQQEILNDIRQTMLQQKINRIKKDINHRKIVKLR